MGNNCDKVHPKDPIIINSCAAHINDRINVQNFCSPSGSTGDSHRQHFCYLISNGNEWGNAQPSSNSCYSNNCNYFQDYGSSDCCNGCCGVDGFGLSCQRLSFTGDPLTCCLNDMVCTNNFPNTNPPECYSDADKNHTCADGFNGQPNYRSLVSSDCKKVLFQYCTGTLPSDDPSSFEWINRWITNNKPCSYIIARNLFNIGGNGHCFDPPTPTDICNVQIDLPIDSEGYFWAQNLIKTAVEKYIRQGFTIGSLPGTKGFNPWEDYLYSYICCPYPGICQSALKSICSNKTAQKISFNPRLMRWCGCHLPNNEYQQYSIRFNIPPECTPICNRIDVIPKVGINNNVIKCKQDICIIDDVTVNIINSRIRGNIDFNQVCNCKSSQCSCIVSNTTVDILNSTIGGNFIPISENCGSLICTEKNPSNIGPSEITVPCNNRSNPFLNYEINLKNSKQQGEKISLIVMLIIIGGFIILFSLIVIFINPKFI